VTIDRPAARIVSLAPSVTELVFAAGAGARLVAATDYSDYPDAARRLPRVGNASRADVERILVLAPDLVIGWKSGNNPADVEKLEKLGIRVYLIEISTLPQIAERLEDIGELTGTREEAARAAGEFRDRLARLENRYAGRLPVTVFYEIWDRPLMTIGGRQVMTDVLRLCGGKNVFEGLDPLAPTVSIEAVIAADPAVIIDSSSLGNGEEVLARWRRRGAMTAVRHGNLFTIPSDLIARPSPRILDGAERLCEILDEARSRLINPDAPTANRPPDRRLTLPAPARSRTGGPTSGSCTPGCGD
jgi:iron complex transport system substrate-binding protein